MRRTGKAAVNLGWRSVLALVGGVASIAALGASCGVPAYGIQPTCTKDSDCVALHGADWYCSTVCVERPADGGTH